MKKQFTVLGISGSTRKESLNHRLIEHIKLLAAESFDVQIYNGLSLLPQFNPDLDQETPPTSVVEFRNLLKVADGILICTPEYALGAPGALKNALDWTVSSMEFSQRPVALITASLSGEKAHKSLLGTLLIIESKMTEATQLLISHIKSKMTSEGKLKDDEAISKVRSLIASMSELMTPGRTQFSARLLKKAGVDSGNEP